MAKIILFDIESTNLDADFGTTLAFGWKEHGEAKSHVISLLDYNPKCDGCGRIDADDDKKLLETAYSVLSGVDMIVSWYGKGFDVPFLNTRMLDAGLKPLPPIPHVDLYFTAKHQLKLSSNRLANVQAFLRLSAEKTPLTRRMWRQAEAGNPKAIRYVAHHCYMDVEVLEQVYDKLRPYVRQHPRVRGYGPCRICGSTRIQSRGTTITHLVKPKRRVQCQECGAWDTRTL